MSFTCPLKPAKAGVVVEFVVVAFFFGVKILRIGAKIEVDVAVVGVVVAGVDVEVVVPPVFGAPGVVVEVAEVDGVVVEVTGVEVEVTGVLVAGVVDELLVPAGGRMSVLVDKRRIVVVPKSGKVTVRIESADSTFSFLFSLFLPSFSFSFANVEVAEKPRKNKANSTINENLTFVMSGNMTEKKLFYDNSTMDEL